MLNLSAATYPPPVPLQPGQTPPPGYYSDQLQHVAACVCGWWPSSVDHPVLRLADRILRLSEVARRLYMRLLSRRGSLFREDQLVYAEVDGLERALQELSDQRLITRHAQVPATELLAVLRKRELMMLFPASLTQVKRAGKAVWIDVLLHQYADLDLCQRVAGHIPWCQLSESDLLARFKLSYFGTARGDFSQFVVEALGIVRPPVLRLSKPDWHSSHAASIDTLVRLHQLAELSHPLGMLQESSEQRVPSKSRRLSLALARELCRITPPPSLQQRRNRALLRLGKAFERNGFRWPALCCLQATGLQPSGERRLRLLHRLGQSAAARVVAGELMTSAQQEQDRRYAASYRRFGPTLRTASYERHASLLAPVDACAIEAAALAMLTDPGGIGWHVENRLPLALMALLYWPVLYAPIAGAFTRPYQLAPNDLEDPGFLARRREPLEARQQQLDQLCRAGAACFGAFALEQFRAQQGLANPYISWHWLTEARLKVLCRIFSPAEWLRLARFLLENLADFRRGFPDLLIVDGHGQFEFVEVKGPTDQLQPMQRHWLAALDHLGFSAFVLKFHGSKC